MNLMPLISILKNPVFINKVYCYTLLHMADGMHDDDNNMVAHDLISGYSL